MKLFFIILPLVFAVNLYAGGTIQGVETMPDEIEWDTEIEYSVKIYNENRPNNKVMEFTAIQVQYDSAGYYIKNLSTCLEAYVLNDHPEEVCVVTKK